MFLQTTMLTIGVAAIFGSAANAQPTATVRDLDRFSHTAQISAGSDVSTIKLQRVKLVTIGTRMRSVMMDSRCEEEQSFRDPGGSWYCPYTTIEAPSQAYEVTYSYTGQPLTSDEYGGTYFTFSVYFRPDELSESARQAIARGKISRTAAESLFDVGTSREDVPRAVIDEEGSKFCDGNYSDGAWVRAESDCKDVIKSKMVAAAPDYVTVSVSPSLTRTTSR